MTKTQHYSLPQWEANDPVRREDFNEAMESIDTALAPLSGQIVIGSYTGDASTSWRTIELGFHPRFVIITGQPGGASNEATFLAISGGQQATGTLSFVETGFMVRVASTTYETYPLTNQSGRLYHYLAIR